MHDVKVFQECNRGLIAGSSGDKLHKHMQAKMQSIFKLVTSVQGLKQLITKRCLVTTHPRSQDDFNFQIFRKLCLMKWLESFPSRFPSCPQLSFQSLYIHFKHIDTDQITNSSPLNINTCQPYLCYESFIFIISHFIVCRQKQIDSFHT